MYANTREYIRRLCGRSIERPYNRMSHSVHPFLSSYCAADSAIVNPILPPELGRFFTNVSVISNTRTCVTKANLPAGLPAVGMAGRMEKRVEGKAKTS
jgi:hypothetical protein